MRLGSVQASDLMIGYGLAVPVVVFVILTWLVHKRVSQVRGVWIYPVSALLILGTPWITGYTTILIGLVLAVSIALRLRIISSC